ncbi:hypothetical protein K6T82_07065 [Flavobacterium sp. 17A]|uniref:Uncharacterized protein n=1 Tax=Flavobacterium potami TaxID=2872310 RepID=A0A9X1H8M9_9FLAO|nr:hypothetical protein [Flavobacterium potami]MBZ4034520.1 hypothetical protein [Flavobacterium potami]
MADENIIQEVDQGWIDYRNSVIENKSKSQDDFEKYINLLASGGIVLSVTFLEKIVSLEEAICKSLIIIGMYLMVFTLLSNLYSHYKSILDSDATIKDIDEKKFKKIFKKIEKRNKVINVLNMISIWSLIIGVFLLVTFATINIYNMSDKQKTIPSPKPATEEKGRTITPPAFRPSNTPPKK